MGVCGVGLAHSALHRPILPPPRREPGAGPVRYWQCAPTLRERDCQQCGHSQRVHRKSQVTDKAAVAYRSPSLRVSKRLDARAAASLVAQNVEIPASGSRSEDSAAAEHRSFTPIHGRSWVATCTAAKCHFRTFSACPAGHVVSGGHDRDRGRGRGLQSGRSGNYPHR